MIDIFYPILAAFGFTCRDVETIDGRAAWVPAEDNYKHFLEYMNKLYAEGFWIRSTSLRLKTSPMPRTPIIFTVPTAIMPAG